MQISSSFCARFHTSLMDRIIKSHSNKNGKPLVFAKSIRSPMTIRRFCFWSNVESFPVQKWQDGCCSRNISTLPFLAEFFYTSGVFFVIEPCQSDGNPKIVLDSDRTLSKIPPGGTSFVIQK